MLERPLKITNLYSFPHNVDYVFLDHWSTTVDLQKVIGDQVWFKRAPIILYSLYNHDIRAPLNKSENSLNRWVLKKQARCLVVCAYWMKEMEFMCSRNMMLVSLPNNWKRKPVVSGRIVDSNQNAMKSVSEATMSISTCWHVRNWKNIYDWLHRWAMSVDAYAVHDASEPRIDNLEWAAKGGS